MPKKKKRVKKPEVDFVITNQSEGMKLLLEMVEEMEKDHNFVEHCKKMNIKGERRV